MIKKDEIVRELTPTRVGEPPHPKALANTEVRVNRSIMGACISIFTAVMMFLVVWREMEVPWTLLLFLLLGFSAIFLGGGLMDFKTFGELIRIVMRREDNK